MATTTSITTNYAGAFASKYISAALLSADTLDKGLVEILPNVNYRTTLQKVNTDSIVRDATCDFDATSTLTLTDRILEVEPFQVNLQLCKKDYYDSWIGGQMGFSAYDSIPASFADFLIVKLFDGYEFDSCSVSHLPQVHIPQRDVDKKRVHVIISVFKLFGVVHVLIKTQVHILHKVVSVIPVKTERPRHT